MNICQWRVTLFAVILAALSQAAYGIDNLGTGGASLLGNDLTDLGNNGVEGSYTGVFPAGLAGFDAVFFGDDEANFNPPNNEGAFNVFDNLKGGGQSKWCCNDASSGDGIHVGADFSQTQPLGTARIVMTHFTLTSDNDSGINRDPDNFRIQGSNDGTTWTDIFSYNINGDSLFDNFGGSPDNRTLRFNVATDFDAPQPFNRFRYLALDSVNNNNHALSEIEFFGVGTNLQNVQDIQLLDGNLTPGVLANVQPLATIPGDGGGHLSLDTLPIQEDMIGADAIGQLLVRVVGVPANGVEISIDKDVLNQSGFDLESFDILLLEDPNAPGFGVGDPTFTGASDTTNNFATASILGNAVTFTDGLLADGDFSNFWLGFQVPGPNSIDPTTGLPSFDFFIQQLGTSRVPEPAGIAIWSLIGLGLAAFGCYRFRRNW